jgi:hypothetical protein
MIDRWENRFRRIRFLGWVALVGVPFLLGLWFTKDFAQTFCGVAALLLILPGFVYVYVMTILQWKDRYRGRQSDLWGTLILIETSGWMKLVYLFRHLIPDSELADTASILHLLSRISLGIQPLH